MTERNEDIATRAPVGAKKVVNTKVAVFYNLYISSKEDEARVSTLVHDQFTPYFDPDIHEDIRITSIGHPFQQNTTNVTNDHSTIREYRAEGTEALTLSAIWEFCKTNPTHEQKVIYLHSKGSYHDHKWNARNRQFLTKGVLSKECAIDLPSECNTCSSRVSPMPHPHAPGNMWLARCDYIAKLIDPATNFRDSTNQYPRVFATGRNHCKGRGRFFFEHWAHSHPSVVPCDLYNGTEYFYGYRKVPDGSFEPDLKMAIKRFPRGLYDGLYDGSCGKYKGVTSAGHALVTDRIWGYEMLNRERPDKSWWGWDFFNTSFDEMKNITFLSNP